MSNSEDFVWDEKYRPIKLDDCIIPDKLKEEFKAFLEQKQVPNLLLYSQSPGTGKTTTAKALCNELGIKPLFINASLNNSIDDIRNDVIQYATTVSIFGDGNIKVVILDEAERLSQSAQESLKGLMEYVSKNCRFILTTNNKSRIIEPLQSRCDNIDFVYTKTDQMKLAASMLKRVSEILKIEGIEYNPQVLAQIVKKFVPDNRRILIFLQRYATSNKVIDEGALAKIVSGEITTLIDSMKEKNFAGVKDWLFQNYEQLQSDVYTKLYKALEPVLTGQSVAQLVLTLGDYQKYDSVVPDKFIHYLALNIEIMMNSEFKK